MAANHVYANRLRKLAIYLEEVVAPQVRAKKVKFDMKQWAETAPKPELTCGTAACAAGYSTLVFKELSLVSLSSRRSLSIEDDILILVHKKSGREQFAACENFFGTRLPFEPTFNDTLPNVVKRLRKAASEFDPPAKWATRR